MDKIKLKELEEHGHYISAPKGNSMWPMLKDAESLVDIVAANGDLKKYDIALYYSKEFHKCVLHRVLGIKDNNYIFYGDNSYIKELVPKENIIGVVSKFKHNINDEWCSVNNFKYKLYVHLWCDFLPLRKFLLKIKYKIEYKKTRNAQDRKTAYDMLYLIGCEINNLPVEKSRLISFKLHDLYQMAQYHNLVGIVYEALRHAYGEDMPQSELFRAWQKNKDNRVRKLIQLDLERAELFKFCEKAGIWHTPLKGIILKDLYPKIGMREVADNDILFDDNLSKELQEWFIERGYTYEERTCAEEHDTYTKWPNYNFEMHPKLATSEVNENWFEYYSNIKEKLVLAEGKQFEYHFTDEDFYIHFIVHAAKHYTHGGHGFRNLLDCFIYCTKKQNLNWDYIEEELSKLGLVEYEQETRSLAQKIFSKPQEFNTENLSATELKNWEYLLASGAYGLSENFRRNNMQNKITNYLHKFKQQDAGDSKKTKFRYILAKLYPDREFMEKWCKIHAPIFLKHKKLMPFAQIYRILTKDVFKFNWMSELKMLFKTKI